MPLSNSPNPISDSFAACTLIPTFVVFWSPEYKSSFSVACITGGLRFQGRGEKRKTFHFSIKKLHLSWAELRSNRKSFVRYQLKIYMKSFSVRVEKPKPNLSQQPIRKKINTMTKLKTSKPLETRENTTDPVAFVFNFASDWFKSVVRVFETNYQVKKSKTITIPDYHWHSIENN